MSFGDRLDLKAWLQFVREGAASLGMRVAALVSTLALGVLLARLLGPAEYGRYGLVMSLALLGSAIAQLGTTQLAVRELSVRRVSDKGASRPLAMLFFRITIAASIAIGLTVFVAAIVLRATSRDLNLMSLGILLMLATGLISIASAVLRGLGQLGRGQFFETIGRPVLTLATTGLVILVGVAINATKAIAIQLFAAGLSLLITLIWLFKSLPKQNQSRKLSRFPWWKVAIPLGIVDILRTLDGSYGLLLMAPLTGSIEVGIYRVALSCLALLAMPATICHIVFAPQTAQLFGSNQHAELQLLLRRVSILLTAVMIPTTCLIFVFGRYVIVAAFGVAYQEAWQPLFILSCAHTFSSLFGMGPIMLAMSTGQKDLMRIYAIAVGLGAGIAVPLIYLFGANGAATAQVLSLSLIGFLSHQTAKRRWDLELTFLSHLRWNALSLRR